MSQVKVNENGRLNLRDLNWLRWGGFVLLWLAVLATAFALLVGFTYIIGQLPQVFGVEGSAANWWAWGLRIPVSLLFGFSVFWLLFHPRRSLRKAQSGLRWISRGRLFKLEKNSIAAGIDQTLERAEEGIEDLEGQASASVQSKLHKPISRRRFVTETALIGAFTVESFYFEPFAPEITRLDVKLPNLPPAFEGLTIAQLSDIHVDPYTTEDAISQMVAQTNALKPDITFVTGDFISRGTYYFEQAARALGALRDGTRLGLYGVSGNHDHWSDGDDLGRLEPTLKKYGLPLLRNTATRLELNGDSLWLLGTDDSSTHNDNLSKTLRAAGFASPEVARSDERAKILLSHTPAFTPQAAAMGADLLLSGHTHGGQVYFPVIENVVISPIFPHYRGYYRVGDRTQVYVNKGVGVVGPPMRFFARPEILLLRLVRG